MGGSGYQEMNCAFYDGEGLASDIGAIVVTINYRIGIFGFLADPTLLAESGTTGNYGLQDQRAALRWLKAAATAFGGDPSRVTVMGQSAGATSVLHHLVLPRSAGLMSRAISMSGYGVTWGLAEAFSRHAQIIEAAGCSDEATRLDCLRSKSAFELLVAEDTYIFGQGIDTTNRMVTFGPVSDGYELPRGVSFLQALAAAKFETPLLIGSTLNETTLFQCPNLKSKMAQPEADEYLMNKERYIFPNNSFSKEDLQAVTEQYAQFSDVRAKTMAVSTDMIFSCTEERIADLATSAGAPVYRYLLARAPKIFRLDSCLGVPHMSELMSLFAKAFPEAIWKVLLGGSDDIMLAGGIMQAWGRFVHGSSPGPEWHLWNRSKYLTQLGDSTSGNLSALYAYRSSECAVMKKYIPY